VPAELELCVEVVTACSADDDGDCRVTSPSRPTDEQPTVACSERRPLGWRVPPLDLERARTPTVVSVSAATTLAPRPAEPEVVQPGVVPPDIVEADGGLNIAAVAQRTCVTAHTLRYYERIGLLTVPRDDAGRRLYGAAELARVVFITRLRLTAMPIRDIQAYFRLVEEGPGNEDQRLALLEAHRDAVKARIADLESALGVVEFKIATYGGGCLP
jgi:DNA-binding transcriptional MerR regulator